jgi:hypothetical protein
VSTVGERAREGVNPAKETPVMGALILALLVVLLLFVLGIAGVVKFLLWVAIILGIIWVIGFFARGAEGRRYRW